jgi:hypothetical protein
MRQHSAGFVLRPVGKTEARFMPINPAGDARLGDTICTRLKQAKGLDVDLSEFRSMTLNSRRLDKPTRRTNRPNCGRCQRPTRVCSICVGVFYDERFQAKYGFWRPVIERSVAAFLRCGDLQEGFVSEAMATVRGGQGSCPP